MTSEALFTLTRTAREALQWLATPPRHSRWTSGAIVVALLAMVAWLDLITGSFISLVPLYFVPITLAVAWLGAATGAASSLAAVLLRTAGDIAIAGWPFARAGAWGRLADLLMYLLAVWLLHGLLRLTRNLDALVTARTAALQEAIRVRQQMERELTAVAAAERSAMGRELHDDLAQQLVGTAFAVRVLAENLDARGDAAARDAHEIVGYLETSIGKARDMARGLLLAEIVPTDLPAELATLAAEARKAGVACTCRIVGQPDLGGPSATAQVYRIAQEAVRNALRHARARHVEIVLEEQERAVVLTVGDDGIGMPPAAERARGIGVRVMESRAVFIGGELQVISSTGRGTSIQCRIPTLTPHNTT